MTFIVINKPNIVKTDALLT